MSDLSQETEFRFLLRDEIVRVVNQREWSEQKFADVVGLTDTGARHLLRRRDWSLERCLAVADALGVTVRPQVQELAEA